jgi:class 3 adenylate cyclase
MRTASTGVQGDRRAPASADQPKLPSTLHRFSVRSKRIGETIAMQNVVGSSPIGRVREPARGEPAYPFEPSGPLAPSRLGWAEMGAMPSGTVTLLFTDIEGSTRAWDAHPTEMREALQRHDDLVRDAVARHGGYVFKTVGDAFCVAFQDASRAVAGAVDAQRSVSREPWPDAVQIRVRMALHSGSCDERDGDYFGPTVNRVARLLSLAHGGQALASSATATLAKDSLPDGIALRDLGAHALKDIGRSERVSQILAADLEMEFPPLRSVAGSGPRHNLPAYATTFLGRGGALTELNTLAREARVVTLTGPGGVGKTRLAVELADPGRCAI